MTSKLVYGLILPIGIICLILGIRIYREIRKTDWNGVVVGSSSAKKWHDWLSNALSFSWIRFQGVLMLIIMTGVFFAASKAKKYIDTQHGQHVTQNIEPAAHDSPQATRDAQPKSERPLSSANGADNSLAANRDKIGGVIVAGITLIALLTWFLRLLRRISKKGVPEEKEKKTWWEEHVKKHPEFDGAHKTIGLIIVGLFAIQLVAYFAEFEPWLYLWQHKIFWVIQLALVIAFGLRRVTKEKTLERNIAKALFYSILLGIGWVLLPHYWHKSENKDKVVGLNSEFTPLVVTESGQRDLVQKGRSRKIELKNLISFDAVPFFVKIDDGEWQGPLKPGSLQGTLPPGTKYLELRCDVMDFYLTHRKEADDTQ